MYVRSFEPTYDMDPATGYIHSTVGSSRAMWYRNPVTGTVPPTRFALRRPRMMREPRTDLGTYTRA